MSVLSTFNLCHWKYEVYNTAAPQPKCYMEFEEQIKDQRWTSSSLDNDSSNGGGVTTEFSQSITLYAPVQCGL